MKVAVLGAGAIARGPHLAAMRQYGVRVLSPRGDFTAHPHATDDPAEVGPADFVLLGLKANAYAACGPLITPLLHERTAVVAAQNGIPWWYFHRHGGPYDGHRVESVDPGGAVSAVLAPERAVGCVVYAAAELQSPGVVRHLEGTRFSVGGPDRSISARCLDFSEAMQAGGLKCPVEQDLRGDIWVKLLGNISFNPISALARATMRQMCLHGGTRRAIETMMRETLAVAEALGCRVGAARLLGRLVDHSAGRRVDQGVRGEAGPLRPRRGPAERGAEGRQQAVCA
ncbi:2-dehydropantoate 2-reductase [Streptomyces sp. NPDC001340]